MQLAYGLPWREETGRERWFVLTSSLRILQAGGDEKETTYMQHLSCVYLHICTNSSGLMWLL